jgi:uncharacterized protein (DUF433 family)
MSSILNMPRNGDSAAEEPSSDEELPPPGISSNPRVMGGKPTIRGTCVTASTIAGLLATGHSEAQVLALHPYLEADDIRAVERWTKEQEAANSRSETGGRNRSDG